MKAELGLKDSTQIQGIFSGTPSEAHLPVLRVPQQLRLALQRYNSKCLRSRDWEPVYTLLPYWMPSNAN